MNIPFQHTWLVYNHPAPWREQRLAWQEGHSIDVTKSINLEEAISHGETIARGAESEKIAIADLIDDHIDREIQKAFEDFLKENGIELGDIPKKGFKKPRNPEKNPEEYQKWKTWELALKVRQHLEDAIKVIQQKFKGSGTELEAARNEAVAVIFYGPDKLGGVYGWIRQRREREIKRSQLDETLAKGRERARSYLSALRGGSTDAESVTVSIDQDGMSPDSLERYIGSNWNKETRDLKNPMRVEELSSKEKKENTRLDMMRRLSNDFKRNYDSFVTDIEIAIGTDEGGDIIIRLLRYSVSASATASSYSRPMKLEKSSAINFA